MGDRPYYVNEDNPESALEVLLRLIPPLFDLLKDIVTPFPQRFSPPDLVPLLQNYQFVLLTQEYRTGIGHESRGDALIARWKSLIRLGIRINESCIEKNERIVSQVLFRILMEASDYHKEEYYQTQHIAWSIYNGAGDEDLIRTALQLYHRVYEGSYRTLISYCCFLIDFSGGKALKTADIESYLKTDIPKSLNQIKNSRYLTSEEFDSLRLGVNFLVRNALAHGGTKLRGGKAYLEAKGSKCALGVEDVGILISDLLITSNGICSGFWLSFLKYKNQIEKHIVWKYDIEKIHLVLYEAAKDFKFIVDECKLNDGTTINLVLAEMSPNDKIAQPSITKYGSVTLNVQVEPAKPRGQRVRDLVESYPKLFYGYSKLRVYVKDCEGRNKGDVEVDIAKLLEGTLKGIEVFNQISND